MNQEIHFDSDMKYQWQDADIGGVGVIFVGLDGRVIVQQRDEYAKNSPNMLALFGGGREEGESPEECLIREMQEEINISFDPQEHRLSVLCDTINTAVSKDDKMRIYIVAGINPDEIVIGEGVGFQELTQAESQSDKITIFTQQMLTRYWKQANETQIS